MKAFTDISQSKKLAEILPLESADMWYWEFLTAPTYNNYGYPMFHKGEDIHNVPCWSLAALLDILESEIDGEECFGGGWFIVMAELPTGQISNHYELKDWDLFQIPEKEVADEWDGHTPQEAAERLHKYLQRKL